jgi:hypothetical protein
VLSSFAVLLLLATSAVNLGAGAVPDTQVTVFRPAVPKGPSRAGECWTDSIAVSRKGGWRCMIDNAIYDPCFENRALTNALICGASPDSGKPGFILELTKPLPKSSYLADPFPRPWLLKLADGSSCEVATGTISFVAGIDVPWGCSDSHQCNDQGCPYMTGLSEDFKKGKVWTAEKIAFRSSAKGMELIKRERVRVVAVWQ